MRFLPFYLALILAPAFAEDAIDQKTEQPIIQNTPIIKPSHIITIRAIGLGTVKENTASRAQQLALAKRAAIVDGYRQLGEKLHGLKITASDTVRDAALVRSEIRTELYSIVRGADVVETIWDNGLCQVEMEVKVDAKRFSELFYAYQQNKPAKR
ncbi:MAG: hypothetical protein LBE89_06955 [Helicobacteraceae bacterium]|jgi:hypothetical protein|nr:hypothetical protein [Helicobacteraceae bacterium]